MLQRNPKSPNELPPTAEVLEQQAQKATDERFEKYLKKRRRNIAIGKVAVGTGLFFQAATAPYFGDVRVNMLETESAEPTVSVLREATDPAFENTATIFFDGFNSYSADHLVKKLGPGYQDAFDGELWSVGYNNAPLNPADITELVKDKIEARGITKVKVVLHSQASAPGTDTYVDIIANTWTDVEDVIYIESPADFDSLTEKTQDELGFAKELAWIPWIEYSTLFRLGLEGYFYQEAMQKNPIQTSGGIATRFENGNMTTNAFLASQINSIGDANVAAKIEEIAQYADTKHMPNISYIMIDDNKDLVVDNLEASQKICDAAGDDLNCTVRSVKSAHGEYYLPQSVEEYNRVFNELANITKPYTTQEAARHALNLYGIYQDERLLLSVK